MYWQHAYGQDFLSAGRELKLEGKYDSAIHYFSMVRQKFEDNQQRDSTILISFEILACHLKKRDFKRAQRELQSVNLIIDSDVSAFPDIYYFKARLKFLQGTYEAALQTYDSAIELSSEGKLAVKSLLGKGYTHLKLFDLKQARQTALRGQKILLDLDLDNDVLMGTVYDILGQVHMRKGEFHKAIAAMQQAIEVRTKYLNPYHPDVAGLYGNLGIQYKNLMQYEKALDYYALYLKSIKDYYGLENVRAGHVYHNIGYALYLKGDYIQSLKFHQEALEIRSKVYDDVNHYWILQSRELIGLCYGKMEAYDTAEFITNDVRIIRQNKYGVVSHGVEYSYYNLGDLSQARGDVQRAAEYFQQAADIGEQIYDNYNYDQADNYNRLAYCHLELGNAEKAKDYLDKALTFNIPGYQGDLEGLEYHLSFKQFFTTLLGFSSLYNYEDYLDIDEAIRYLHIAEKHLNAFKRTLVQESDLILASTFSKDLSSLAYKIFARQYQLTGDEVYIHKIFEFSEKGKATTFISILEDAKAKSISGISTEYLQQDQQLRKTQDSLKSKVIAMLSENEDDVDATKQLLFETKQEHEQLIQYMEDEFPIYSKIKFGGTPIKIPDLQRYLARNRTSSGVVQFFLTEAEILTLFISEDQFQLRTRPISDLPTVIQDFRTEIETLNNEHIDELSARLYQDLIAPISDLFEGLNELVIIPDGILGYLPFELLYNAYEKAYLFEKYNLSYHLSTTAFAENIHASNASNKLIAYAPSYEQRPLADAEVFRSDHLIDLPGARQEAQQIAMMLRGDLKLGPFATEEAFKTSAANYGIIHLAAHTVINETNPDQTKLVLTGSDKEDGNLYAFELKNMQLQAELVTLSSCDTGYGEIARGEGVMNFARSFNIAGVKATVASLWAASDKSTPKLMAYFYENLKKGQTKDLALNNARKTYLAQAKGKARHPFYWGGFVLIGDNKPIQKETSPFLYSILILFLIITGVIVVKRRM